MNEKITLQLEAAAAYNERELTEKRLRHTQEVEELAVRLASLYGVPEEKARLAARCHDCCRKWSQERMDSFVVLNGLNTKYCHNIELAHSKVGELVAKMAFDIQDQDVLNAISYHTTGRPGMSTLEKIIYLADALEPGREYPGVEELRVLAEKDLDQALLQSLESSRDYVLEKGGVLDGDTLRAIQWLQTGEILPEEEVDQEEDEINALMDMLGELPFGM